MHLFNVKNIIMKKKKPNTKIEEIRKNSRFFKLVESVPHNNSKVGQTFIMKVSCRNITKS
jgi:hypothetical protein